ncbi:MAG: peptidase carboxypeptidase [Myxococcales bacterium]|nr:peptidase carboxypeptidase [Myxococcales bacterium]
MLAGVSVEGRSIEAIDIAGSIAAPGVGALVFGAIHGDEPGSAELCRRFVAALSSNPPLYRTVVVPALNPDGLSRLTKNNARDVDLNRNFAARNWTRAHPPGYDPGPTPESEPESAALAALVAHLSPRAIVAVHQPFRCVNWDGTGEGLADDMALACGYPSVASVGYPTPGSFGSRYGVDEGRRVITLELPRPVPDGDWDGCLRALRCCTIFPPEP